MPRSFMMQILNHDTRQHDKFGLDIIKDSVIG